MAVQGMTGPEIGGIINVAKPAGMTSFGVVARVRRIAGLRRVGHCGTLDPFATGVLPVVLGRATGAVRYMEGYDKSYRVAIRFGSFTDTQDLTGTPIGGRAPTATELELMKAGGYAMLRNAVASLEGEQFQMPPMYSAIKIGGRHLYEYARKGLEIERASRRVTIYRAEILGISTDRETLEMTVDFDCSKGTYIRTLCQDLGEATGFGAHAAALERTACGPFQLEQSFTLEQLEAAVAAGGMDRWPMLRNAGILLPVDAALPEMIKITAGNETALHFIHGRPVGGDELALPDAEGGETRVALYGKAGFVGVGVIRPDENGISWLRAERVFADIEDYRQ